jgi:hypothetical protein
MNRDCYQESKRVEPIAHQNNNGVRRGWVRSVDFACTKWLLERGIVVSTPRNPLLSTDVLDDTDASSSTPKTDVQAH